MRTVNRSAIVPYSAEAMFALVADVEAYPSFLPWCSDVVVHSRDERVADVSLEMRRGAFSKVFRTRNTMTPHERMELELLGGPFRHLAGGWRFRPLGEDGSEVALALDFEFDSRLLDRTIGPFFEDICNRLVDAFTQRAVEVYGSHHE